MIRYCDCKGAARQNSQTHHIGTFYPTETKDGICKFCDHFAIKDPEVTYTHNWHGERKGLYRRNRISSFHTQDGRVLQKKSVPIRSRLLVTFVDTGETRIYSGIKPALQDLGVSQGSVHKSLRTGEPHRGMLFSRLEKETK